jgi:hypothetical protein
MPAETAPGAYLAQTAVNASAELVASLGLRTVDELNDAFSKVFTHVHGSLVDAAKQPLDKKTRGGRAIPIVSQEEIQRKLSQSIQNQNPAPSIF